MNIDPAEWVERVSKLALINLSEEEKKLLIKDMARIIDFFNMINELKGLDDVEPLFMMPRGEPVLRDDEVGECLSINEVLMNVKEKEDRFIKGPRTA